MTDEPEPGDGPADEADEDSGPAANFLRPGLRSALEAFQRQQRLLASYDFKPLPRTQELATQVSGALEAIKATERSINFGALQAVAESARRLSTVTPFAQLKADAVAQLVSTLDLSAIKKANGLLLHNWELFDLKRQQAEQISKMVAQFDFPSLAKQIIATRINWGQLRTIFEHVLPSNLHSVHDLAAVADLALDEGLPVAWVPRHEIIDELLRAVTPEERLAILDRRADDILDDCEAALEGIEHEWAEQCRSSVSSFRHGFVGPAQSHAGNIIDSIIYAVLGRSGRDDATRRAQQEYNDLPLHVAVENLVLRPLFFGFIKWYPGSGDPIPDHFARHPTAHAVGQPGVFSRRNALIAVMLATSLTVQFWDDPSAP